MLSASVPIEIEDDQAFHVSTGPTISRSRRSAIRAKAPDWLRRNADGLLRRGKRGDLPVGDGEGQAKTPRPARPRRHLVSSLRIACNSRLTFGARFRIAHLQPFERVEDDLRDDQPGVFLVVGGNDVPGRVALCSSR